MFWFKRSDSGRRETINRLYGAIVARAREPVFYRDLGVPDTVEGRFDFLVLHLHLVNERLAAIGEEGMALGQELLDRFFEDMDASLREIGIGDLSVPKKMRTLAEAYLGRSAIYGPAIAARDKAALASAIVRNILGTDAGGAAPSLARYAIRSAEFLSRQPIEQFLKGQVDFADPEGAQTDAE